MKVPDFITWFCISLVVGILMACIGCGPAIEGSVSAPGYAAVPEVTANDGGAAASPGSGQLPIGYYQRQCQWDACGGPLPNLPTQAVDPIR